MKLLLNASKMQNPHFPTLTRSTNWFVFQVFQAFYKLVHENSEPSDHFHICHWQARALRQIWFQPRRKKRGKKNTPTGHEVAMSDQSDWCHAFQR